MTNHRKRSVRRVAVITGTRAEYGLLRSTIEAVRRRKSLKLQLVATGMHLLKKFGHTIDDITTDGWNIDARVPMQRGDDGALDQAEGLARGISGIARFLDQSNTDIVVVLGDRIEAMAGALAAVTTGRLLAHIHGGDVAPGDFDDSFRHAITKLAHLHLTATQCASKRVIRMGEDKERVHWVGAPGLDHLRLLLKKHSGKKRKPTGRVLILQHPCGRTSAYERRVMSSILKAVDRSDLTPICIHPNSDRGHTGILAAIDAHSRASASRSVDFEVVKSLSRDRYLRALIEADVVVGNSSSGIIEAATAGTATVDIGPRQRGRTPGGKCIVHADESFASVERALCSARRRRPIMGQPTVYGDGSAGRRIADLLTKIPLSDAYRRKVIAY